MKKKAICIGIVGLLLLLGLTNIAAAESGLEVSVYVRYYRNNNQVYSEFEHATVVITDENGQVLAKKTNGKHHMGDWAAEFYEFSKLDQYRGKEINIKVHFRGKLIKVWEDIDLPEEDTVRKDIRIDLEVKNKLTLPVFERSIQKILNFLPLLRNILKL